MERKASLSAEKDKVVVTKPRKVRRPDAETMTTSLMSHMNTGTFEECLAGGLRRERGNVGRTYAQQLGAGETALLA